MYKYMRVPLRLDNHRRIYYDANFIEPSIEALRNFLESYDYMHTLDFAKEAMEYMEIKANNAVEGLNDDLSEIDEAINNRTNIPVTKKQRIINLHKGYHYILAHHRIEKDNLRELYAILSKDLLDEYCQDHMGEYYREAPVYILKSGCLDIEPYKGINEIEIESYMNAFFEYVNSNTVETEIDNFIKSQIMHFYFVYVHPYFDVNGRTSRTVAMWQLLNTESYPYIIFNRAISLSKNSYEKNIIQSRNGDVTSFLKYMLETVKNQLEKERVIHNIIQNVGPLQIDERQIIDYLLSMKQLSTIKNLATIYNYHNVYRNPRVIAEEYVLPLMERGIIIEDGMIEQSVSNEIPNYILRLNDEVTEDKPHQKILTI